MNANLPPKTPAIEAWIHQATLQLAGAGIGSAKLDAELILAHTIRKNRTYLHAHGDEPLSERHVEIAEARLALRKDRTPLAYIIGHKEFYGRRFKVTPATLIPRPESEPMIDLLKELVAPHKTPLLPNTPQKLVDVGTGTGCLGISAKLELPELDVTLCDVSHHALMVAKANAEQLEARVTLLLSNLLDHYPLTADYIIANLPYVDPAWERSPETTYEPELALFAASDGLSLIYKLIEQAPTALRPGGYLLLEADPRQHIAMTKYAKNRGFSPIHTRGFIVCFQKQ